MKNLLRLACGFGLDQSERNSSQVNASAREACPNGVAIREVFNLRLLAPGSVWPGLKTEKQHDDYSKLSWNKDG